MILSICAAGPLAEAIRDAAGALREPLRVASVTDQDLFTHALGCKTIVYAAEPWLLDPPSVPDTERMRTVLKAAHAPGVKRVVAIFPEDDVWREETLLLQKDGVGYTIIRSPPIVDELADATNHDPTRPIRLRRQSADAVSREAIASAIQEAITRDDLCGAAIDVSAEKVHMARANRRAANVTSADGSRCSECGGALERHRLPVLVDPRGVVFPRPVAAVACSDCGRTFAAPQVWSRRDAEGARTIRRGGNLAA